MELQGENKAIRPAEHKQVYCFPDENVSFEATSIGEATEMLKEFKRGKNRNPEPEPEKKPHKKSRN